jgi:flagellar biosynthesis/type III secretory pathway protein FliH
MSLARGRRLPGPHGGLAPKVAGSSGGRIPRGQRIPAPVVAAAEQARAMLARAAAEADAIRAGATAAAAEAARQAADEARQTALAELAARQLALRVREERADVDQLERTLALARVLAERLLAEELRLDPGRIIALARAALREASGSRRATVVANPADGSELRAALAELQASDRGIDVADDPSLPRGSLRIRTDLGELDADLGAELDRLVDALRGALTR